MNTQYNIQTSPPAIASGIPSPVIASGAKQSRRRLCSPDGCQATACSWIASFLAMTAERETAMTRRETLSPVIASGAKQSGRRLCSPDGCQAVACSRIASFLAMTGQGGAMTGTGIREAERLRYEIILFCFSSQYIYVKFIQVIF
jgi:hypothetical protein